MPFKPKESAVLETIIMSLDTKHAIDYCFQKRGFKISTRTFYEIKAKIKSSTMNRLGEIAREGFVRQHLERVDELEVCRRLFWEHYFNEKTEWKKALILEKIVNIQPYLSAYYEEAKEFVGNGYFVREKSEAVPPKGSKERPDTTTD